MSTVIILGSGPGVLHARDQIKGAGQQIVAINNAWQVRPDWDFHIHPEDFPAARRPDRLMPGQRIITAAEYVPLQNQLGGFVYAGGTMAFTAAYWALMALRPRVIAMIGCDMVYPASGQTHFYGTGTADPLRPDISLRCLEAKAARLMLLAAQQGCAMVNLSTDAESRLVYPRATWAELASAAPQAPAQIGSALAAEAALGYSVASGRYWEEAARFDPAALDRIDTLWLHAAGIRDPRRQDPSVI